MCRGSSAAISLISDSPVEPAGIRPPRTFGAGSSNRRERAMRRRGDERGGVGARRRAGFALVLALGAPFLTSGSSRILANPDRLIVATHLGEWVNRGPTNY